MGICLYRTTQGRTRDGEEHGSAQWASPKQVNAMFCQKKNKLLTKNVRLGLDTHKHRRSLNVLVIGGSGAAKTRSYVLPNILEANTNYVITDPKMEVLTATGGYLASQGYDIRVLNLVNLEQSDGYNPFRYIRDEKDALRLVNNLIQATTPKGSRESDPFWTKSETALLQAIILMLFQEAPESEQNFSMVMRVLKYAEVREEDEDYASVRNPEHELMVKRRAIELLGLPVVCGHEMTGALGYYERTVTTVLNARLLPLIHQLLDDMKRVMDRMGITAPLMVVRGDGSLMRSDYAADRPVETILSGPAASVAGARFLSGCENGIVVDMGGTTTDIAGLRHGDCAVSEEGAILSGWRTRVRALEIFTFGLGGDSEIVVSDKGDVQIGPRRVVPLCRSMLVKGKAGLTPTDILHASGAYRQWPAQRSVQRIHALADRLSMTDEQLVEKLYRSVVGQLVKYCRLGAATFGGYAVLIGVGAPAVSWLTAAAAQLKIPSIVPPHAEVANAVGAAVGQVCETSQALVRRNRMDNSYYIYMEDRRIQAPDLHTAQKMARDGTRRLAYGKAARAGAEQIQISSRERLIEGINRTFVEWRVTAKAMGYPPVGDEGSCAPEGCGDSAWADSQEEKYSTGGAL